MESVLDMRRALVWYVRSDPTLLIIVHYLIKFLKGVNRYSFKVGDEDIQSSFPVINSNSLRSQISIRLRL
jgi:hypothetical protein